MLREWLEWHHLIFLLPLAVAVLMILLAGFSDLQAGGTDADVAEAGFHADAGVEADAGLESGSDADVDGEVHTGHNAEGVRAFLEFFGVGHLPLSLLLQTIAVLWGGAGLILIQIAPPVVAIPLAALVTMVGARGFAVVLGRLLGGSEAAPRSKFVGKMGEVVLEVTPQFGVVHVRDDHGTLYRLNARTEADALEPGQKVVVVGYDPQGHLYEVADPVRYLESGGR